MSNLDEAGNKAFPVSGPRDPRRHLPSLQQWLLAWVHRAAEQDVSCG